MHLVELAIDDDVVAMPRVILVWITPVYVRHYGLEADARDPATYIIIEYDSYTVHMSRQYAQ